MVNPKAIAALCHAVNKAYCESIGDYSHKPWDESPQWQRESVVNGVIFHLEGDKTPQESHESWMQEKEADGWVYGLEKDPEKKTHPCMVPYSELPQEQRSKDYIFGAICQFFNQK